MFSFVLSLLPFDMRGEMPIPPLHQSIPPSIADLIMQVAPPASASVRPFVPAKLLGWDLLLPMGCVNMR